MAKDKNIFFCQECGFESTKWVGQCPGCKAWNTMVEEPAKKHIKYGKKPISETKPVKLSAVETTEENRVSSGMNEFDRVLGGGIVKGSLVLIGGDPGIGKSTLLLQMCHKLSDNGHKTLYVSGEESPVQIKMRSKRFGTFENDLMLYCETNLDSVEEVILNEKPEIVIIDSIQTMYKDGIDSAPGSVSQIRESTGVLMRIAKQEGISIFIVGHVTKEGAVAGPRVLEHMVDTVLYFEGDRYGSYRVIRAVKNRFGSTNEIGVFEMRQEGLWEVINPSEYMLSGRPEGASGSVVTCAMEGTRPLMVEIQALTSKTGYQFPKRTASGFDYNRINILTAVLEKNLNMALSEFDIYVNIAGGMRITEPAMDLAIISAIISSKKNFPVSEKTAIIGEVGLAGEVRAVNLAEKRVKEAAKLGFEMCIVPKSNLNQLKNIEGITIIGVGSVKDLASFFKN